MTDLSTSRRQLLAATALGATGVAALTACGSDEPATTGNAAAGGGMGSGGAGGGEVITSLGAVPVGGALVVKAGGKDVVVAQPEAGQVVAFSAACTHQGCTVEVRDKELACPCHASKFEAATGAVLTGPATKNLPPVAVAVDGDHVVTA